MNPETFFDKFGLLADTPNGVQKLRELILQLAVQGKLVRQDENDEPAAVLLEKIKAEKERLVKERKIRKSKPLLPIEIDEIRFEIPESWEWIRLNQIGDWGAGATPNRAKSEYYGGSIKWLKSGELNDGYVSESYEKVTESALKDCSLRVNKSGDVLIAMYGATIGKVAILEVEATTNQAVCACTCLAGFYNRYLFLLLKSYRQHFSNQGAGGAQPNISRIKIINTVAPLPPFEEQRRIVAKVDQLMALCDELEVRQQKKQETRLRLNSASLDKLLTAHEPAEFANHWQRVCDNFDLFYDHPETVGELRKAILQLAVQGKLVRQDANDEPAAVLLEGIREKKGELMKEGKIKKTKTSLLWEDGEVPHKLPKEWKWTKFSNIATIASNLVKPEFYLDLPHVAPNNIEKKTGKLYQYRTIREDNVRSGKHKFYSGQILYSKIRPNLAKVTIVNFEGLCSADMYPINAYIDSEFLLKYMLSQTFLNMSVKKDTRVAMPKINQSELNEILVSVPPLAEQRRIVTKVDQLMALCDELESKLDQSQTDGAELMEAVVAELVGA